ncbi:MAG TPA: ABC transporter permease [Stellaceae bacterium]|jgi:sulfonate transport system permease protein|nr:ABC transporter permease [Stellaceae bacterium]
MARSRPISLAAGAVPRLALVSLAQPRAARRDRPGRTFATLANAVLPWLVPLALLLLWQIATSAGWLAPQILPSPVTVAATFADLVTGGDIVEGLAISLRRITVGFAIGTAIGLPLGVALGRAKRLEDYLGPSLRAIAQVPSLGWLPFLMLIFGLGETLNYVIIAKACFIPIALNTSNGIRNLSPQHLEMAHAFRLRRKTMLWRVVVPGALPSIFSGVRLALSHAWIAMVIVEMLADTAGIGYLMNWGRTLFQIDVVLVGMILIGAIGFLMDRSLRHVERRLQRWRAA